MTAPTDNDQGPFELGISVESGNRTTSFSVGSNDPGPVLSTRRGQTRSSVSDQRPDDIVTVHGIEMTVEQAAAHGFVVKDGDQFRDFTLEETAAKEKHEQEIAKLEQDLEHARKMADQLPLDQDTSSFIDTVIDAGARAQVGPTLLITEALKDPGTVPSSLVDIARAAGADYGQFAEQFKRSWTSFENAAHEQLIKDGLSPEQGDEFWKWALDEMKPELARAASVAVLQRSFEGFRVLLKKFQQSKGMGRGAQQQGVTYQTGTHGEELVTLPNGMKTTVAAARRAGQL